MSNKNTILLTCQNFCNSIATLTLLNILINIALYEITGKVCVLILFMVNRCVLYPIVRIALNEIKSDDVKREMVYLCYIIYETSCVVWFGMMLLLRGIKHFQDIIVFLNLLVILCLGLVEYLGLTFDPEPNLEQNKHTTQPPLHSPVEAIKEEKTCTAPPPHSPVEAIKEEKSITASQLRAAYNEEIKKYPHITGYVLFDGTAMHFFVDQDSALYATKCCSKTAQCILEFLGDGLATPTPKKTLVEMYNEEIKKYPHKTSGYVVFDGKTMMFFDREHEALEAYKTHSITQPCIFHILDAVE